MTSTKARTRTRTALELTLEGGVVFTHGGAEVEVGYLSGMGVPELVVTCRPDSRGQGHASRAMSSALSWCDAQGLIVYLSIVAQLAQPGALSFEALHAWYSALGWRDVTREPGLMMRRTPARA